ncbi:hypothetical protein EYF80_041762 [Liparis tanakae]|uniref:Uncharacterized protein n=1 Tax=Liparis tanakae TaxID=230148 RepID=A0A4Z2G3C6_9TELE|nr:hypothetical protein EYF80_041762 [Liparis tanakae]
MASEIRVQQQLVEINARRAWRKGPWLDNLYPQPGSFLLHVLKCRIPPSSYEIWFSQRRPQKKDA